MVDADFDINTINLEELRHFYGDCCSKLLKTSQRARLTKLMVLNTNKEHKNIFLSQTHQFFNTCKSYCDGIIINRKIIMYKLNDLKNPIYQNDTTLFINPAKKIYESKNKPYIKLYFLFFHFSQILNYSAFAEENRSSELWHDEDYKFTYLIHGAA